MRPKTVFACPKDHFRTSNKPPIEKINNVLFCIVSFLHYICTW